ncbi:MAG: hypothetical protein OXQ32_08015 [bacterium]|nr:hypothetical protein [bacterium]MDE0132188.1 hypothetical protein [bacterium]
MGAKRRHRQAVALMAVAVMFFSTNALFIKLTLGDNDAFLYNAGIWVGMSLGLGAASLLFYRPAFADPAARRVLFRRVAGLKTDGVRRWDLIGLLWVGVVGRFAVAFFAWATQYVEAATVSVLHYAWPVIFILGLSRWDRSKRRRYRRVTGFSWTGLGLAFVGMAAVVIGTLGFDLTEADLVERVFGMVLAVISALLLACNTAVGYPMSESISSEITEKTDAHPDEHRLEFGCLLFVGCASGLLAVVPNLLIGWAVGGDIAPATFGCRGRRSHFRSGRGPGPEGGPDHSRPGCERPDLRISGGGPPVVGVVHRDRCCAPRSAGGGEPLGGGGQRVAEPAERGCRQGPAPV